MKKLMIAVAAAAMVGGAFAVCEEFTCVTVYRVKLSGKSCYGKTLAADKKSKATCEDSCWLKPCSYRVAGYLYGASKEELEECESCTCQESFIPEGFHFWDNHKKQVLFTPKMEVFDILRNGGDKKKAQVCFTLSQGDATLGCAGFGEMSYKTYAGGLLKGASGFFAGTVEAPVCSSYDESTCEESTVKAKAFTPCKLEETEPAVAIAYGRWNLAWKQDKVEKVMKAGNFDCLYPTGFKAAKD